MNRLLLLTMLVLSLLASYRKPRSRSMPPPRLSEFFSGSSSSASSDSITTILEEEEEQAFSNELSCSFSPPDFLDNDVFAEPERRITVEDVDLFQGSVDQLDVVEDRILEAMENYDKAKAIYELLYEHNPIRPQCEDDTACESIVEITEEEESVLDSMRLAQRQALKDYRSIIQDLRRKRLEIIEDLKLIVQGRRSAFLAYFEAIEVGLSDRIESVRKRHRYSRRSTLKLTYDKVQRNLSLLRGPLFF